jgi:hypothetical protein
MDNIEQKQDEEKLRSQTELLSTLNEAMTLFLEKGDWNQAFGVLLSFALKQTGSEYGFSGVLVEGPVLRILAHEGIVWDRQVNYDFYQQALRTYKEQGFLEFKNFNNLFGQVLTTGKVVVSNDPAT